MSKKTINIQGVEYPLDRNGYLADTTLWQEAFAMAMAKQDGLELDQAHWQLIEFVRDYYEKFQISPPMRALVKAVAQHWGEEKGNSRYLYRLFPDGPAKQLSLYGGLPKPVSCI